jgi:hypothetical protein
MADAEAICKAVTRADMRFVPTKTPEQQSCLMLHRTRHLFIRQQTALINSCCPRRTRAIASNHAITGRDNEVGSANPNMSGWLLYSGGNANCRFWFIGTTPTLLSCYGVPMKGNNMTNQNQPGQQNQAPGQKPGQQQGGGQKPGQQSQTPGKDAKNPKEPHEQTSDTDT